MQLFAKALLAPFLAGQAIAKVFTRTFMPALVSELAKQAEQQKKQDFVEKVKKDPNILIELIKKAKSKVETQLESIKQKLVEIKKSIAKLTLIKNMIGSLSSQAQKLQKELEQIKDKIQELEKVPGKEKELEKLKNREKEIEKTLDELAKKIELKHARMEELEKTEGKLDELINERNELELTERKYQLRLNELDAQQLSSEQALGIAHEHKKPLEQIRERGREEKAKEQIENTDLSYGNFAFKATLDGDFNMHNVQSQKVMPVFGWMGKDTPAFMKQKRDDSIAAKYSVRSSFIQDRLDKAANNGRVWQSDPSNNKEQGGRDNYPGR